VDTPLDGIMGVLIVLTQGCEFFGVH
jgi:hypothetical protein